MPGGPRLVRDDHVPVFPACRWESLREGGREPEPETSLSVVLVCSPTIELAPTDNRARFLVYDDGAWEDVPDTRFGLVSAANVALCFLTSGGVVLAPLLPSTSSAFRFPFTEDLGVSGSLSDAEAGLSMEEV